MPTPIGNLDDITLRAIEVLRSVDIIAAEDTRHSQRLLSHYDIKTSLVSFHEHSGADAVSGLIDRIKRGGAIALISDAGTPLVSDPGYDLVREAQEEGLLVSALPGACAAITALSAAGLPAHNFRFVGFLSSKPAARRARLDQLKEDDATLIFYEAPHRILGLLEDASLVFGVSRLAVMARELTKTYETIRRDTLGELLEWVGDDNNQQRGEIVLLIAPAPKKHEVDISVTASKMLDALSEELPPKRASQLVAKGFGLNAKQLYQHLLDKKSSDS